MAVRTTMRVLRHIPKSSPATRLPLMAAGQPRFNRGVGARHPPRVYRGRVDCPATFLYGERMRRIWGLLLVAVLCAGCSMVSGMVGGMFTRKRPAVPSEKLWSEGNQAMQDEAWDLAIQDYKALLEQYPFDP